MKFLIRCLPFLLLWGVFKPAFAFDCEPSLDSCEFYLCMESKKNCGYNGFPLRIGYRFCNQFMLFKPYSAQIQAWLPKTRKCIQEKLVESSNLQCNQFAWSSVQDHVECYVGEGYCQLSALDRKTVRKFLLSKFVKAPKFFIMNTIRMLKKGCF